MEIEPTRDVSAWQWREAGAAGAERARLLERGRSLWEATAHDKKLPAAAGSRFPAGVPVGGGLCPGTISDSISLSAARAVLLPPRGGRVTYCRTFLPASCQPLPAPYQWGLSLPASSSSSWAPSLGLKP